MSRIAAAVQHLPLGYELKYIAETDSTNRLARELPDGAWRSGIVIFTDFQREGRGRKGRAWSAPPRSSLLLSLLLDLPPHIAPADVVVAGALAVADAATQVVGKPAALKWPNDVLVGGKKVSGILAEFSEQNGRRRTVLGIGLNVNFDPASDGVPDATGLATAAGSYLDREQVAAVLLTRLDAWYSTLMRDADLVFAAWAGRLETVGASVLVLEGDARWNGEAIGVERSGALIVRTADGTARTVLAADVSIRKTGSFTTP